MARCITLALAVIIGGAIGWQNLLAECSRPERPNVSVMGVVCGTATFLRQPLPDTDVQLVNDAGDVIATERTDAKGDFAFPRVAGGAYRVKIAGLYGPPERVIVTNAGTRCRKPVTVNFMTGVEPCDVAISFEGELRLLANVPRAFVSVDEHDFRTIEFDEPFELLLEAGLHHVVIHASGYRPYQFDIAIHNRQITTYRATLRREGR